jgi:hypothetical protein
MFCAGDVRIGPLRQRFWAVATPDGRVRERTALLGSGGVHIDGPRVAVDAPSVRARLVVDEQDGVETLSRHGRGYIWTRKQGGARVRGLIEVDGQPLQVDLRGMVDDSAGYHARHTVWSWSAGVGSARSGRVLAWNLVAGVHDAPRDSERTLWVDGAATELRPVEFAGDLSAISGHDVDLRFSEWAAREDRTNAILLRSSYRQPFGTFTGTIGGEELVEGYGVMESHDVWW